MGLSDSLRKITKLSVRCLASLELSVYPIFHVSRIVNIESHDSEIIRVAFAAFVPIDSNWARLVGLVSARSGVVGIASHVSTISSWEDEEIRRNMYAAYDNFNPFSFFRNTEYL